jgi:hypothetical protein
MTSKPTDGSDRAGTALRTAVLRGLVAIVDVTDLI